MHLGPKLVNFSSYKNAAYLLKAPNIVHSHEKDSHESLKICLELLFVEWDRLPSEIAPSHNITIEFDGSIKLIAVWRKTTFLDVNEMQSSKCNRNWNVNIDRVPKKQMPLKLRR